MIIYEKSYISVMTQIFEDLRGGVSEVDQQGDDGQNEHTEHLEKVILIFYLRFQFRSYSRVDDT